MLSNDEMNDLLSGFDARMKGINDHYIRLMAEHIRDIGQLTASDVDRLEAMRRCSRDMNEVQREIRKAANLSDKELEEIFTRTIESGIDFLGTVFGKRTISLENNYGLRKLLAAQIQQTRGALQNFSNTTVVSKPYQNAVDKAIQAVQSGMTDYRSAIRSTVRQTASEGLRVLQTEQEDNRRLGEASPLVRYQSGITRRLDTAARQNILDGVRQLSQQSMDLIGAELGADGVEISAHMLCAEDHVDYQGEQFTNAEFDELQRTLRRPFGEWNCRHMWWPVFIGISRPTHSKDELQQFKDYSREQITITSDDGHEITRSRYEWTQEQRRLETAIRQQKDIMTAAKITGDKDLERACGVKIMRYNDAYKRIVYSAGIISNDGRKNGSLTTPIKGVRIELARKVVNTGSFAPLTQEMSENNIRDVAAKFGIDVSGVKYIIERDEIFMSFNMKYYGVTDPEIIGNVNIFPWAFENEEQLVRTIYHENIHIEQLKKYGAKYCIDNTALMDREAFDRENEFIKRIKDGGYEFE